MPFRFNFQSLKTKSDWGILRQIGYYVAFTPPFFKILYVLIVTFPHIHSRIRVNYSVIFLLINIYKLI